MRYLIPLLLLIAGSAQAQIAGLAMRCDAIKAATQAASCTGSRTWVTPNTGDYILSYPSAPADSTTVAWGDVNLQYREWSSIPNVYGVTTCSKALTPSQVTIPAGGIDQCAPAADKTLKPFTLKSAMLAPVVVPASSVTLSWTAPTANTDGSTPAVFEGFNVYRGSALPLVVGSPNVPLAGGQASPISATTFSYTDKSVTAGTYYYAVTAWHCETAGCTESDPATTGAVTIPVSIPKPGAPGSLTKTVNGVKAP